MDEFGVLTERFGIKPQGKAAPMAASKRSTASATNGVTRNFDSNSGPDAKSSSYNSNTGNGSFISEDDFLFLSNANNKKSQNYSGFDDVFGHLQNSTTTNTNNGDYDDVFGLNNKSDDVFGSFSSPPKQSGVVGDLLGGFDGEELKSKSSKQKLDGFDDLIPGFGGSSSPSNRTNAGATKSTFMSAEDPFVVLERPSSPLYGSSDPFSDPLDELGKLTQRGGAKTDVPFEVSLKLRPPPKSNQVLKSDKVKSSPVSSIDELENFAMGRVHNGAGGRSNLRQTKETRGQHSAKVSKYKEAEDASTKTQQRGEDDIESFFSVGARSSSVPRSRATTVDPIFDAKVNSSGSNVAQRKPSVGASNMKKVSFVPNTVDDLSAIFGASPGFGAFEEYEGESVERRRARLERHQRTQYRMNKALADMNNRDRQVQQEQEEKRRIADALDFEIKNWAAGKEGNMRALLSSLQNVLWPECGWEPVSLTDLITSSSVKKVYKKATLCVHPDKVQQKGATIQQKYTAEKVFDILKEAWNKFNKEELS